MRSVFLLALALFLLGFARALGIVSLLNGGILLLSLLVSTLLAALAVSR